MAITQMLTCLKRLDFTSF